MIHMRGLEQGQSLRGVPSSAARDVVLLPWNEPEACSRLIEENASELGSLIVEPMIGDGYLVPVPGFLQMLRDLCTKHGIVLIFDEAVMQSLSPSGAGGYWGVTSDLVILAKGVAGGGLPLAAVGGQQQILDLTNRLTGLPQVPHGSTFAQHPLTVAAGIAQLRLMTPEVYRQLHSHGDRLRQGVSDLAARQGWEELQVTGAGNLAFLHWKRGDLTTYADHVECDDHFMYALHQGLLNEGYYIVTDGRLRLTTAMTDDDIDGFVEALGRVVKNQAAGHH
jgi:glutamate-1-semialdehyde 2,1-aminomutase